MIIEITSSKNPKVTSAARLLKSKYRKSEELFLIEGARLCYDAAISSVHIIECYFTEEAKLKYEKEVAKLTDFSCQCYQITKEISSKLSDTDTPQGVFCVCKMLDKRIDVDKIDIAGKILALDEVSDPSNLGAIFRTAEALGIDGCILSEKCCSPFNPKALRASMGATFRFPFYVSECFISDLEKLKKLGMNILATVPSNEAKDITKIKKDIGTVAVIGNEGNGISDEVLKVCSYKVTIPMLGRAESLNASMAAGIVMWELVRGNL